MSASPPKADMCGAIAYVCYGRKADIRLFDQQLVTVPYGCLAGPIWGARTGLAMPKKITTPWPPQRVDSASLAFL